MTISIAFWIVASSLTFSLVLLTISAYKYIQTCFFSKQCQISGIWKALVALLVIFIVGYGAVIGEFIMQRHSYSELPKIWMVVVAILFFGSIFCLLSANLFQHVVTRVSFEKGMLQHYIDSVQTIILSLDKDAKIEMINPYGAKLLGYNIKHLIGRDWINAFIPNRLKSDVRKVFESLRNGGLNGSIENYENPVITKNGQEVQVAWHNTVIYDENGNFARIISCGRAKE